MKEKIEDLIRLVLIWTVGILGGISFLLLKLFGRIKVQGYEKRKFIPPKERLIIIYNHPFLWEPAVIPFLFFPFYLFYPNLIPFSTPDTKNYYNRWWFLPFRLFSIPIEREGRGKLESFRRLLQKMRKGRIVVIAPEGGRTFKGEEFKVIESGKIMVKKSCEETKKSFQKIRRFKQGVFFLMKKTQATLLPIWVETQKSFPFLKMKLKIGEHFKSEDINSIEDLEDLLLKYSEAV